MKKISPWLTYFLVIITSSLYFYVWIFLLMNQLNSLSSKTLFNTRKRVRILLSMLIPFLLYYYLVAPHITITTTLSWQFVITIIVGLFSCVIVLFLFANVIQVVQQLRKLEEVSGVDSPLSIGITVLSLFGFLIAPYMQFHMNKIIDKKIAA